MEMNDNKLKEIDMMNKIIFKAIVHGGDNGGPYYSNQYGLYKVIEEWLKLKDLSNDYIITEKEIVDSDNRYIYTSIMQIVPVGIGEPIRFNDKEFIF